MSAHSRITRKQWNEMQVMLRAGTLEAVVADAMGLSISTVQRWRHRKAPSAKADTRPVDQPPGFSFKRSAMAHCDCGAMAILNDEGRCWACQVRLMMPASPPTHHGTETFWNRTLRD